jgi:hypothetical protein
MGRSREPVAVVRGIQVDPQANLPQLPRQFVRRVEALAADRAGSSIAARMPMMAITTKSSISVNPMSLCRFRFTIA